MLADRHEAGARLAAKLAELAPPDPVVLALPRGGVPVALPIAQALRAPLDLLMVRKLGMPGHEELAAGAVVEGDPPIIVFNRALLRSAALHEEDFRPAIAEKLRQMRERRVKYLAGRAPAPIRGKSAIVVDDGIATGATVRAALKALAARRPAQIILAVPVAPRETLAELEGLADRIVCLETPFPFYAVGAHYRDFHQVSDREVIEALARARPKPNGQR